MTPHEYEPEAGRDLGADSAQPRPTEHLNCKQVAEFTDSYVASELAPMVHSAFDAHLSRCPPCIHFVDSYKATIELEKGACEASEELPALPPALVQAILKARKKGIN